MGTPTPHNGNPSVATKESVPDLSPCLHHLESSGPDTAGQTHYRPPKGLTVQRLNRCYYSCPAGLNY
ncbi:hypothetical protein N7468_000701 [Penicillium chermesinum]|uniref:Uncharacterized protein n=1 Tax=Penicillium chermesinum TaxID=63820 RepID=A0A9W9PMN5_9EURO|nr:uncharacterized protein N7468_000701 [Penicillium chermesinum]KAJ5249250.1 hypothetical protein N7468_000701 [Penicillium chermesinum]